MNKGLMLCGVTVLLWALYAVYARFAASVWAVDPLVFGSLASLAAGVGLVAAAGPGDGGGGGRAALRSPHTWVYGLLDVLAITLIVGACLFASATELVLLLRVDVIYGLGFAWMLFGRPARRADLVGIAAIAVGCGLTLSQMAPHDAAWAAGLVALGSLARAAATAVAERHPATAAADSVRRRCRTTGTIMLASALLYLAAVAAAAVAGTALGVSPRRAGSLFPDGTGFADPTTMLAAAALGLLIYAPATYFYFQASRIAGTEIFLMTLVYQPFVTLALERLLAWMTPMPSVAMDLPLLAAMACVVGGSTVMLAARQFHATRQAMRG